jgi:hypothetical protein
MLTLDKPTGSKALIKNTYDLTPFPDVVATRLYALKPSQVLVLVEPAVKFNTQLSNFEINLITFGDVVEGSINKPVLYKGCVASCVISWVAGLDVPTILGQPQYTSLRYCADNLTLSSRLDMWYQILEFVRNGYFYHLFRNKSMYSFDVHSWDFRTSFSYKETDFEDKFQELNGIIQELQELGV